jgi:TorA maturation chaperone TorD
MALAAAHDLPKEELNHRVPSEELMRAAAYGLLARLLVAPPDARLVGELAALAGGDGAFGAALTALSAAAVAASEAAVAAEYHDLFIGLGRGELLPYGSFYLAGFLHERPLAQLRRDLAALGVARAEAVKEPEDHIGALCEVMAGLIDGRFGAPFDLAGQRAFFAAHLEPWAPRFFKDLEGAAAAAFYRPVGALGRGLMTIETAAFAMMG